MDGHHTYVLRKIVRNGSLARMADRDTKVEWRHLEPGEKRKALLLKLEEEVREARTASPEDFAEELADIVELVRALAELDGITDEELEAVRREKVEKRGDYSEGYYVEVIHCPIGSHWDEYCAKHPENYPRLDTDAE